MIQQVPETPCDSASTREFVWPLLEGHSSEAAMREKPKTSSFESRSMVARVGCWDVAGEKIESSLDLCSSWLAIICSLEQICDLLMKDIFCNFILRVASLANLYLNTIRSVWPTSYLLLLVLSINAQSIDNYSSIFL